VRLRFLIPAYNEEGGLGRTLSALRSAFPGVPVLVTFDGNDLLVARRIYPRRPGARYLLHLAFNALSKLFFPALAPFEELAGRLQDLQGGGREGGPLHSGHEPGLRVPQEGEARPGVPRDLASRGGRGARSRGGS